MFLTLSTPTISKFNLANEKFVTLQEGLTSGSNKSNNRRWKQLCTLTNRSFVNMTRDMGYYWMRILFYILVSIGAGVMFFDIGLSNSAFITRAKCYAFLYDFLICLSVGGLPSFIEEWKVKYNSTMSLDLFFFFPFLRNCFCCGKE